VVFEFSSGINVFIGENGTGKTHLLKVLYAAMLANRAYEEVETIEKNGITSSSRGNFYIELWQEVFLLMSTEIRSKFSKLKNTEDVKIKLEIGNQSFLTKIKENHLWTGPTFQNMNRLDSQPFFLPPNEMLSWYRRFVNIF
jgi:predicted ATP-dependent endonuclease of OLD family